MKICKNCQLPFSSNTQQRVFCYDCSPIGSTNTHPSLRTNNPGTKICIVCHSEKPLIEFAISRKTIRRNRCKKCDSARVAAHQKQNRLQALAYKGGKCEKCGYNKCIAALEFHHIDPTKKEFGLGQGNIYSFTRMKKELDKCQLLCSNCHREIHWGV